MFIAANRRAFIFSSSCCVKPLTFKEVRWQRDPTSHERAVVHPPHCSVKSERPVKQKSFNWEPSDVRIQRSKQTLIC